MSEFSEDRHPSREPSPEPPVAAPEEVSTMDTGENDLVIPGRVLLNIDQRAVLAARMENLRTNRDAAPKEGDDKLDITVFHKKGTVLLPKGPYYDEQNLLGLLVAKLAYLNNYDIVTYETSRYCVNEPTNEVKNFFIGFILGCDDRINLEIRRKSNVIELGRACSHAFRVRGEFRDNERLTSAALRKNQPFFGNDPKYDPKTKGLKERMLLDQYLEQYLEKPDDVKSMKHALTTLLEGLKLDSYLTDKKVFAKCIKDNLTPLEQILDVHRRIPKGDTKPKKKESKKAVVGKLPERPTTSPMITKEEFEEIGSYLGPLWSNFTDLHKGWCESVKKSGYSSVKSRVDLTLKTRWLVLEAVSAITTKRLREIRSHSDDSKITKRRITQNDFSAWYNVRPNPKTKWLFELAEITKPIRTLSAIECGSILYSQEMRQKARDLATKVDELRYERSTRNVEHEPDPADRVNPYNQLDIEDPMAQQAIMLLRDVKNFKQIIIRKDSKTEMVTEFSVGDVHSALELGEAILSRNNIDHGSISSEIILSEFSRKKSGPNSLLGKIMNALYIEDEIIFVSGQALGKGFNSKWYGKVNPDALILPDGYEGFT
jgi:hypothetical protein